MTDSSQFSGLATRNPVARAVFAAVTEQPRFKREALLEVLVQQTSCERRDVVRVLRELEALKAGRLIVGRRKQKTRFAWTEQFDVAAMLKKALVLSPKAERNLGADMSAATASAPSLLRHRYLVRPSLEVELSLPPDLSVREAERLADFIKTLPLDAT